MQAFHLPLTMPHKVLHTAQQSHHTKMAVSNTKSATSAWTCIQANPLQTPASCKLCMPGCNSRVKVVSTPIPPPSSSPTPDLGCCYLRVAIRRWHLSSVGTALSRQSKPIPNALPNHYDPPSVAGKDRSMQCTTSPVLPVGVQHTKCRLLAWRTWFPLGLPPPLVKES